MLKVQTDTPQKKKPLGIGWWIYIAFTALIFVDTSLSHGLGEGAGATAVWLVVSLIIISFFSRKAKPDASHESLRGSSLVPQNDVLKQLKGVPSRIKIGPLPIPIKAEAEHFLLSGATGTGKSLAFHQILRPAREAGHRAVIPDVGGEFVAKYYRDGDVILNPFDARSKAWSPLSEMRDEWDAARISKSLIPDADGSSAEWQKYAQTVFSAVLHKVWESGCGTNAEIVRLLLLAPQAELKEVVSGTPAARLFEEGNDRMLASVLSIVSTYVSPLTRLDPTAGESAFSIRDWVDTEGSSFLFFNFTDSQFAELKPLVAASVDIAISQLLDQEPSETRRVWFPLDEFATLGKIQSIGDLLTKARKKGGCGVLGVQTISQPRATYGMHGSQTLLSCLGTWLVLRPGDADTAEYLSKFVGDEEIRRTTVSTSDSSEGGITTSTGVEYRIQRAVLPSELTQLPVRTGILNVVGPIPPTVVEIPTDAHPEVAPRFVPRKRDKRLVDAAELVA